MQSGGTFSTAPGGAVILGACRDRDSFEITNLGSYDGWLTTGESAEVNKGVYLPAGRTRWFHGARATKQWKAVSATAGVIYCIETFDKDS